MVGSRCAALLVVSTTVFLLDWAFAAVAAVSQEIVPPSFDAPFGCYPNILQITQEETDSFHPVVVFPKRILANITIKDHRQSTSTKELASNEEIELRKKSRQKWRTRFVTNLRQFLATRWLLNPSDWGIGKYDEHRDGGMYGSDLFRDLEYQVDGYGGKRNVHLGMDLGGPVGTPVYAFCDGTVHSIGYNPDLGDYGHVIVVQHHWGSNNKTCWALYGHLGRPKRNFFPWKKKSPVLRPGDIVTKGQRIGYMGDIDENGGWTSAHLHFQLSTKPPDQPHDMPGTSSVQDRAKALLQYADPRYVTGPLYG